MNINNYIKWLKSKLDSETYIVSKELNIDANNTDKVYVVVKQLAGNPTRGSITLPIQLEIYTTDPSSTLDYFTLFAQTYHNTYIKDIVPTLDNPKVFEPFVAQQIYMTPTIMQSDIPMGGVLMSRIVLFATLNVFEKVNNIHRVKINGEVQNILNGTLSYAVVPHATRVSGKYLTIQKKQESTTTLTFTMYSTINSFSEKVALFRQGLADGTELFDVDIERLGGKTEKYKMLLKSINEPFSQLGITNTQVEMVVGENPIINKGE